MWRAAHRVLRAAALIRSRIISPRRDARAAESDGLENHCGASHRGFKSHSLRSDHWPGHLVGPASTSRARARLRETEFSVDLARFRRTIQCVEVERVDASGHEIL